MSFSTTSKPLNVVIIGGSLSGLMHGIMLRANGHNVIIIEQTDDERESHMAGVCCAWDCQSFFTKFDRVRTPFTLESERLQFINSSGDIDNYFKAPRLVTSWDAYYWRLRANFDGFESKHYPEPPPKDFPGAGSGEYLSRHLVLSVEDRGKYVSVKYESLRDGSSMALDANLVLSADGPNSYIRGTYLADCDRQYSGYVAWRGTVPEAEISAETIALFEKNVTLNLMESDHALVYLIPGENGSLKIGERLVNFLWYTNHTREDAQSLMRDSSGHQHRHIVPRGKVHPDQWHNQLRKGSLLSLAHREVLEHIKQPFLQKITDFVSPQAAFANGKILLVGDSLSLYRPHTASSANNAAFDCLMLEQLVQGKIDLAAWNRAVVDFAQLHWARSVWYGENYQRPFRSALPSALRYWYLAGWNLVESWILGANHKLRW